MPLIQGGPPEWIWERSADFLKWDVVPVVNPEGHTVYELRVSCGMEIMRLQFWVVSGQYCTRQVSCGNRFRRLPGLFPHPKVEWSWTT
jgi:hypothetical protein